MAGNDTIFENQDENYLSVCVLASGSKGNSVYVSDGNTRILFDAGLSAKELERRLNSRGLGLDKLDAVVVSHEHSDHIRGVGVLSRRLKIPVYITQKTQKAAHLTIGKVTQWTYFECGASFIIKTLKIHPFSISHDAADPAGFTVRQNGLKVGIATDLGIATALIGQHLKECNLLVLEANHDENMLLRGPYPWHLKQRIKSRMGHLSNEDSKELLKGIRHRNLTHVVLAHISEENNTPQKALSTISPVLDKNQTKIATASQYESSELFFVSHVPKTLDRE